VTFVRTSCLGKSDRWLVMALHQQIARTALFKKVICSFWTRISSFLGNPASSYYFLCMFNVSSSQPMFTTLCCMTNSQDWKSVVQCTRHEPKHTAHVSYTANQSKVTILSQGSADPLPTQAALWVLLVLPSHREHLFSEDLPLFLRFLRHPYTAFLMYCMNSISY
jgi:hypothetical protein